MVTSRVPEAHRAEVSQQHANYVADRTFTGDANIRPGLKMESPSAEKGCQHPSSTVSPAKQPVSMQPAFTMGSGAASVSPSKKRAHKDLKMRQTAASASSSQPARPNPFAPYGVGTNASSSQAVKPPAKGSPGKPSLGGSPHRRIKVTLKLDRSQGMIIDSGPTSSFTGKSSRSAAPSGAHPFSSHPSPAQPSSAGASSSGTFFPQSTTAFSSNASFLPKGQTSSTSFPFRPAAATDTSRQPTAAATNPASPVDNKPTGASASGTAASPAAAATPSGNKFRFGFPQMTDADTSSAQPPFQGFGAAGAVQDAPETPTVSFPGFQPGVQNQKTPGLSTVRKSKAKGKVATPSGTPMSAFSQGTPFSPMDISPQGDTTFGLSTATPPPQPHFTPAWAKSSAAPGSFSFSSGAAQQTPDRAASRQSPRTRKQGSKPAAEMPKSRFMPQDASDSTTAPSFGPAPPSQPSTAGMAGIAHLFGSAQDQSTSAGKTGSANAFGVAQARPDSAGTIGASDNAPGFAHSQQGSGGTAGFMAFGTQHTAQTSMPNGFGCGSSQAGPSGFFTSASSTGTAAFPFSVPGRPMDSRIKDACATGFMGINLDSNQGSHQNAQMPTAGAPFTTTATPFTTAAAAPTLTATAGPSAAWRSATADPNAGAGGQQMPQASFQFQPAKSTAFSSGAEASASNDTAPTTSSSAPVADPPVPLPPFTMGAKGTPKQQSQRPMLGSEHLATNLNDKLVLEAELAAAAAASAAAAQAPQDTSAEPTAAAVPSKEANAASTQAVPSGSKVAGMPAGDTAFSASKSQSGAAQPATQQMHSQQQHAQQQHSQQPASSQTASAASMAEQPTFVFGARPAATNASASRDQQSQPYTFSFGAAPATSSFPATSSQPAGSVPTTTTSTSGPFVFGAKSPAAAQAAATAGWYPPTDMSRAVPRSPASKAPSSNAGASQSSGWPPSGGSAAEQSIPMQFSAGQASSSAALRNGLHSPSGVAKHTGSRGSAPGAGQHSRAVPSSPHARRTARGTPRKQTQPEGMPAGVAQHWGRLRPPAGPLPRSQWSSEEASSSAQPAGVAGSQQQAPALQPEARQSGAAQQGIASAAERAKIEATAEQHRQKGNLLFAKPDFLAAGVQYTKGLNVLNDGGIRDGDVFVKLLTNRAACHLSLAHPLKALQDCTMAVQADPSNVRAATRAATCYLKMGQLTEAAHVLDVVTATVTASGKLMPPELVSKQNDLQVTKRLVSEAMSSLQAANNVEAVTQAQKLLESLSWEGGYCPFSQHLLALNAHALLRLQRLEEAVRLAKKHAVSSAERPAGLHWPWWVHAQACFLKGDLQQMQGGLQEGVKSLEQHPEHEEDVPDKAQLADLIKTAHRLLQLKEAGNKAVQASHWQTAITSYSEAINACADAPPLFTAVLHSNRAAAYQGLQQYADAVADSLRSKALDPSYAKAYSRLAAVLSSLHLSGAAVSALEQLAELVKKQGGRDPFKTAPRLDLARRDARRKQPVHHYRLLGLTQSCTDAEIRKAYKKCSLRFHPDKAITHCKFAPALGTCGAVLADRQDIESRVREEANWLFKCISEANVVLSDQQKRLELDSSLNFEERRMFYRNDLHTPPGGTYSFHRPQAAPANPRPSAYSRPSANTRPTGGYWWQNSGNESDDSEDDMFGSNADHGSNFY